MIPPPSAEIAPAPTERSGIQRRLATGLTAGVGGLVLTFLIPAEPAFVIWLGLHLWAAVEFVRMARRSLPTAPLHSLYVWIPLAGGAGFALLRAEQSVPAPAVVLLVFALVPLGAWSTLAARGDLHESLASAGLLAFAVPYFVGPPLCIFILHRQDPFLVLLLLLVVTLGDTAAFFVGRSLGRHKMAPRVSPNKTWEGALAGLLCAVTAAAGWAWLRLDQVPAELLLAAAVTAVAAQTGDLVESMFKRGAGVKDSSHVLPGHGGVYDRLDAFFFAAPTLVACLWLLGFETALPR